MGFQVNSKPQVISEIFNLINHPIYGVKSISTINVKSEFLGNYGKTILFTRMWYRLAFQFLLSFSVTKQKPDSENIEHAGIEQNKSFFHVFAAVSNT